MSENTSRLLSLGVCNNSNANPVITKTSNEQIGNKTECALLEMAFNMGYDYKKYRNRDKIKKISLSAQKKRRWLPSMKTIKENSSALLRVLPIFCSHVASPISTLTVELAKLMVLSIRKFNK